MWINFRIAYSLMFGGTNEEYIRHSFIYEELRMLSSRQSTLISLLSWIMFTHITVGNVEFMHIYSYIWDYPDEYLAVFAIFVALRFRIVSYGVAL